jgi:hypothetical protein
VNTKSNNSKTGELSFLYAVFYFIEIYPPVNLSFRWIDPLWHIVQKLTQKNWTKDNYFKELLILCFLEYSSSLRCVHSWYLKYLPQLCRAKMSCHVLPYVAMWFIPFPILVTNTNTFCKTKRYFIFKMYTQFVSYFSDSI